MLGGSPPYPPPPPRRGGAQFPVGVPGIPDVSELARTAAPTLQRLQVVQDRKAAMLIADAKKTKLLQFGKKAKLPAEETEIVSKL